MTAGAAHASETGSHEAAGAARADGTIARAARAAAGHMSALARLEARLARQELREKAAGLAAAIALGIGAAILALYGLGFALAAAASGLDAVLPRYASLLVVAALVLALAALLGLLAKAALRRARPPVPEQALEEARQTRSVLRSGTSS